MADSQDATARPTSRADRWVKLALLAAAVGVGVYLWWSSRQPTLTGLDLATALQQAQAEQRRVVVLFMNTPPGHNDRHNEGIIAKSGNLEALRRGNFLLAIEQTSLSSDMARTYRLTELPTLMMLAPDGREIIRAAGVVGEVPFRSEFLTATSPAR